MDVGDDARDREVERVLARVVGREPDLLGKGPFAAGIQLHGKRVLGSGSQGGVEALGNPERARHRQVAQVQCPAAVVADGVRPRRAQSAQAARAEVRPVRRVRRDVAVGDKRSVAQHGDLRRRRVRNGRKGQVRLDQAVPRVVVHAGGAHVQGGVFQNGVYPVRRQRRIEIQHQRRNGRGVRGRSRSPEEVGERVGVFRDVQAEERGVRAVGRHDLGMLADFRLAQAVARHIEQDRRGPSRREGLQHGRVPAELGRIEVERRPDGLGAGGIGMPVNRAAGHVVFVDVDPVPLREDHVLHHARIGPGEVRDRQIELRTVFTQVPEPDEFHRLAGEDVVHRAAPKQDISSRVRQIEVHVGGRRTEGRIPLETDNDRITNGDRDLLEAVKLAERIEVVQFARALAVYRQRLAAASEGRLVAQSIGVARRREVRHALVDHNVDRLGDNAVLEHRLGEVDQVVDDDVRPSPADCRVGRQFEDTVGHIGKPAEPRVEGQIRTGRHVVDQLREGPALVASARLTGCQDVDSRGKITCDNVVGVPAQHVEAVGDDAHRHARAVHAERRTGVVGLHRLVALADDQLTMAVISPRTQCRRRRTQAVQGGHVAHGLQGQPARDV